MKIISLLMTLMILYYVYPSEYELTFEEAMPYSSTNVTINGDINGIIAYGIEKIQERYGLDDITVNVNNCSNSIAGKYSPAYKSIVICKEFIRYVEYSYKSFELSDYNKSVNATILFILYHEFAHMFKDIYNLPIVGNEEIASDQFAALMLIDDDMLYNHLEAYKQLIALVDDNIPAWDEHPDYEQQYYNLACLLYGSNEDKYSAFAIELNNRASRCNYEYDSVNNAWSILLNI